MADGLGRTTFPGHPRSQYEWLEGGTAEGAQSSPETNISGFNVPGVRYPSSTGGNQASIKAIMNRQLESARDFRNKQPAYEQSLYNQQESGARSNLAKSIKDTQKDFNRRGLLRSGGRIGAEYQKKAQTAGDLAAARYDINKQVGDQADQLENNAIATGYTYAGANPNLGASALAGNKAALDQALSNMQSQQSVYGNIAKAAGTGLGYYFGNNSSSPTAQTGTTGYAGNTTVGRSPGMER